MHQVTLSLPIEDWHRIAALIHSARIIDPDDLAIEKLDEFIGDALVTVQNQSHAIEGAE